MRIEKLTENKIRITLSNHDLEEKNIDFHSFMSNSIESQSLFLDMLDEADKQVGFCTKDYKLMIEALSTPEGNFILTVTRTPEETESIKVKPRRIHIKRKSNLIVKNIAIYRFSSFEDFCSFCNSLDTTTVKKANDLIQSISLYLFNSNYYLILNDIIPKVEDLKSFCSIITEFGTYLNDSNVYIHKLVEYGKVIMEKDAITTCLKHFCKK